MTYSIAQNQNSKPQSQQAQNSEMSPMELALLGGDLSKLSEKDRAAYYSKVCESVGLNPLTWPFEYIKLDGKLKLYAKKDCADQLRNLRGVSISKAETRIENGLAIVEVTATTKDGRSDCDMGCVPIQGLSGNALGNALMKAVTKAKRRVTLSICGLGWLDETEVESIQAVQPSQEKSLPTVQAIAPKQLTPVSKLKLGDATLTRIEAGEKEVALVPRSGVNEAAFNQVIDTFSRLKWSEFHIQNCLTANFNKVSPTELIDDELLDLMDYLAIFEQTSAEVKRLGWNKEHGQAVLLTQFGVETRNNLNFKQLRECLAFLKTQQPAQ